MGRLGSCPKAVVGELPKFAQPLPLVNGRYEKCGLNLRKNKSPPPTLVGASNNKLESAVNADLERLTQRVDQANQRLDSPLTKSALDAGGLV
jgi:hypothetical protein